MKFRISILLMPILFAIGAMTTTACTDDPVSNDHDNVEPSDYLGYGELLPGPDYVASEDPTYRNTVTENGGPQTPADWRSLQTFEVALNDASGELWRSLPGTVADEFPALTEAERNQLISDFQDTVATATLMRDSATPNCVDLYQSQDGGATGAWTTLCDGSFGPEVRGFWPVVAAVATRVAIAAGRWAVQRAAPAVGRFVVQRALPAVRAAAGQAVQAVRAAMPVVRMRAVQVATWARSQAGAGWNFLKQKYVAAKWWQKALVQEAAWQVGENAYGWVRDQLFGHTETQTTPTQEATRVLRESPESMDALFDR